jgi:hypothetical protein
MKASLLTPNVTMGIGWSSPMTKKNSHRFGQKSKKNSMSEENKREATPEERQKIIKALEAGNVKWSPAGERYWQRAGVISNKPDFTVVDAQVTAFWGPWEKTDEEGNVRGNNGGMEISCGTVSAGFGTLTITLTKDGKLKADTEGMGKKFCKEVLAKLIDSLEDEPE